MRTAAEIRAWCCPEVTELQPGQVVWLAHGTHRSRRTDPRLFVPVVLTLLTPEEMEHPPSSRAELKRLKMRQLERITAEAWRQDGVLTTMDLEWVLHISRRHRTTGTSPALVKEHLELAKKYFPDPDAIRNYLVSRAVRVEELASGV